jgi:hypothetical protein
MSRDRSETEGTDPSTPLMNGYGHQHTKFPTNGTEAGIPWIPSALRFSTDAILICCCPSHIRGPFEEFVDSLYYSESGLRGGAVKVSFTKYLPWQAMHFLQGSTHFSKTCCRPLITSKFLTSELPFHGWKSPEIAWGEIWTVWWVF